MAKMRAKEFKQYLLIIIVIWTAGVIISLGWNIYQLKESILDVARTSAEINYDKDLLYRRWAAKQGGVYVPVSEMTPANPYLKVPNRDIKTSNGLSLTLVNPAYMTRQVYELGMEAHNDIQGHITSLNPIRPENRPDPWETASLKAFQRGIKKTDIIEMMSGKEQFRLMMPFVTEKACLKCHAVQGYKEGDIRGGISVSIPMAPLRSIERSRIAGLAVAHGFLWIMGLTGLGIGARRLRSQTLQREKLEENLLTLSITDPLTDLRNRRGFLSFTEQQLKVSDRTKKRLILFFADLDGMKQINDTLGHEDGDKALIEAAFVFKEAFRSSDIIARMGGDEFAILAIDTEEINPAIIINRLQNRIDAHNKEPERKYMLSISTGYSIYDPENKSSIDELMASADKMMYAQKKNKKSNSL